jgi:hypothetical protein
MTVAAELAVEPVAQRPVLIWRLEVYWRMYRECSESSPSRDARDPSGVAWKARL